MKVRIEQAELAEAVFWLTSIAAKRPYMPILAGIRVEAADGMLRMQATDLELAGEVELPAAVDEPGVTVVSTALFHAVTSRLPDAPVTLAEDGSGLSVRGGRVSAGIPTLTVEDFPQFPTTDDGATVTFPSTVVDSIAKRVAIAAGGDKAKPFLQAVNLIVTDGHITAAATDSYRAHVLDADLDATGDEVVLVPPHVFAIVARMEGPVHAIVTEKRVEFAAPDRRLTTTLVAGKQPDPATFFAHDATPLLLDREELAISLKRCIALASSGMNVPAQLSASDGVLEMTVAQSESGHIADSVSVDGETDLLGVSPTFLLAAIDALGSNRVQLEVDGRRPIKVSDPDGGAFRAVVMPMALGKD